MTPGLISKKVIADRLAFIEKLLGEIEFLPLISKDLERIKEAYILWIKHHPEKTNEKL